MHVSRKRILLCVVTFLFWFAQYVYNPFMTPFLLGLSISATLVGTIVGAYGFTQLIVRLPVGVAADRMQKHRGFIILGLFLSGMASLLRILFPTAAVFLAANAISGVASSMWISFTILFSCYYQPQELSRSIGTINAVNNAGILCAYILGGVFYERFGMSFLFWLSLTAGLAGAAIALFIQDEPVRSQPLPVRGLLTVVKEKRLLLFSITAALFQLVVFATANSFTSSVIKSLGATGFQLGVCSAVFTTASMLSSYFVGTKPAQRIGEKPLMVAGFALLALYCAFVPRVTSIPAMVGMQILGGLGANSLFSLLMSNAIAGVGPERRSSAMGLFQSVYSLGIMLGPVVMGALVDGVGMTGAFTAIAGLTLACTLALPLVFRAQKP